MRFLVFLGFCSLLSCLDSVLGYGDGPPSCALSPDHGHNRAKNKPNPGYRIVTSCSNGQLIVGLAGNRRFKGYILMPKNKSDGRFSQVIAAGSKVMEGGKCVAHSSSYSKDASSAGASFKSRKSTVVFGATIVESEHEWYTIFSGPLKATC